MTIWSIEPRAPIILRDGRPFGLNPGARAESLDFPFPSTIAGAARSRHWRQQGNSFDPNSFGEAEAKILNQLALRGPLLMEFGTQESAPWLVPAPNDALLFPMEDPQDTDHARLRKLSPIPNADQALSDAEYLKQGWEAVTMLNPLKIKPLNHSPRYWHWANFEQWLVAPTENDHLDLPKLGHAGPEKESRVHVGIRPDTQTSEEGRLFQTTGLEFQRRQKNELFSFALAIDIAGEVNEGLGTLGGEQRLVRWRKQNQQLPACPNEIRVAIHQQNRCRLILLTPAFFRQGAMPSDLLTEVAELEIKVEGAIVQRPQTVSGWDHRRSTQNLAGRAKPTRRLAPAGTVYFLRLAGSPDLIDTWIDKVWMQTISDRVERQEDPTRHLNQDRLDGFGLAVVGTWL
jgi:CRISPR-associated protein Cmr3